MNAIINKASKIISLHINSIQISEYMSRAQALDENQVNKIMTAITEETYLPGSEIWVNAITASNGQVLQYRLIGGRHRLEAARRLQMETIPALIFYNLTDEQECLADRINNERDGRHKPVSYFQEAEHYNFLHEVKGWTQRQIARVKNVSKTTVHNRLQLANISPAVIKMSGQLIDHLPEKYAMELLKLDTEQQELAFQEIAQLIQDNEGINFANVVNCIDKYKQMELPPPEDTTEPPSIDIQEDIPEPAPLQITEQHYTARENKGLRFSTTPMWLRHSGINRELCTSAYILLIELISYDLRYQPDKDAFFFIKHSSRYQNTTDFLADIIGIKSRTLEKKVLPSLKDFVYYRSSDDKLKFQIKWDKLYEVYKTNAHIIPYDDGGLEDIPATYTGWIKPTPYHGIYIEKGKITSYKNLAEVNNIPAPTPPTPPQQPPQPSQMPCNVSQPLNDVSASKLGDILKELNMSTPQINICLQQPEITENVLKYINEMPPAEKDKIQNKAGYIYSTIKNGFKPPDNFITVQAAAEKKDRKASIEAFGARIKAGMDNGTINYFCPRDGEKYKLTSIPSSQIFLYNKRGNPGSGHFSEWLDEKYFVP